MLPRASSTGGRSCRVAGVKKDTFERIAGGSKNE